MLTDIIGSIYKKHKSLNYLTLAGCGLFLSVATFSSSTIIQMLSFFSLLPVMLVMLADDVKQSSRHYLLGLIFFAFWLLPCTYWYYSFMHPLVAIAASVGFVLLLANSFNILALSKNKLSEGITLLIFCVSWATFTFLRLHLPLLKDWWIPHLGYALWRNPALLQLGKLAGEASIEFCMLAFCATLAYLNKKKRLLTSIAISLAFLFLVIGSNYLLVKDRTNDFPLIIAIQCSSAVKDSEATAKDLEKIKTQTMEVLGKSQHNQSDEVYVVWPENRIPPYYHHELAEFAKAQGINLIYHSYEPTNNNDKPYKTITWVNRYGEVVLKNYKENIAPGENGSAKKSANIVNGKTAYICYDVHYPTIVKRMTGAQLAFVALNDEEFWDLQKTFHLADMALRAVQADVWLAAASKDGPSAIISKHGVIINVLPFRQDGYIIYKFSPK